jgi:chitodextrinase
MSNPRSVRWYLLSVLLSCTAMLAVTTAPAGAAGGAWGELSRFGPGSGKTQLKISSETNAFGVDPTTNTVFIGDEPTEHEGKYRIQELNSSGQSLGSVPVVPQKTIAAEGLKGGPDGIEGIAVDAANERIYVLAIYERAEATAAQENKGEEPIDELEPVAGILYAFSTKPNGAKELVPAPGANAEGVLATPTTLKAQGEAFGDFLLEPSGITVDPTTGDVLIAGEIEDAGEVRHIALQRVTKTGTLGSRYVDPTETGEEEAGGTNNSEASNSPVVSSAGQVYIQQFDKIVQIPSSFASINPGLVFRSGFGEGEELLQLGGGRAEAGFGGGLSIAPEVGGGTLFASTLIKEAGGTFYSGVMALKYTEAGGKGSAAELGWTGGGSIAHGASCVISTVGPKPEVAAGKEGHVFVLDGTANQVIEFGPGGKGCPTASATPPNLTVNGAQVSEVKAGGTVKLSSVVSQGNALSVEWDFGEGEKPQLVATNQHQLTEVTHKFAKTGEVTVTEKITTDNLATPTVEVKRTVKVIPSPPTAAFSAPTAVAPGQTVELNAGASSDPNHSPITQYAWKFGDGQEATTSGPTTSHVYSVAGLYTVELTVTDGLGLKGKASLLIGVEAESSPPPPPPPPPPPGPGDPGLPGPGTGGGSGGVQGFIAKVEPNAQLAGTSLSASAAGAVIVKVSCPAGVGTCAGTVTLRTLGAVSARAISTAKKKAVLTLATGAFSVAGGKVKTTTLHLSAKARALLARSHVLRARATILAHDTTGASHTAQSTVTLRAPKTTHHHG